MAKEVIEVRLSVDTVMDHPRNQGLLVFIKELEQKSDGQLKVKFYHSAQLYKDVDILKALALGTVDMALPGIWQLDKVDPNSVIIELPMFYGRSSDVTRRLSDGEYGKWVNKSMEKRINVKIPGMWQELGHASIHLTNKKVTKIEDFKGLKIRYFGSKMNSEKLKAIGANPVSIPWPDMPMALLRGVCDGLTTSISALKGAKLVESGITYSVMDKQQYNHYVPMLSNKFWSSLSPDLQVLFTQAWDKTMPQQRAIASRMQADDELAVEELEKKKGGGMYRPSDDELTKWRKILMPVQGSLIKELKIDPQLVEIAEKMLEQQ
jgi:TRAP-type C4-dicarboxylate transport system substrate-binding protein